VLQRVRRVGDVYELKAEVRVDNEVSVRTTQFTVAKDGSVQLKPEEDEKKDQPDAKGNADANKPAANQDNSNNNNANAANDDDSNKPKPQAKPVDNTD